MTAAVKSDVVEEPAKERSASKNVSRQRSDIPPKSAVRTLPSLITPNVAAAMLLAMWSRLTCYEQNPGAHGVVDLPKVTEHHGRAEDHGGRISGVGAHDVAGDMTASRLEQGVFLSSSQLTVLPSDDANSPFRRCNRGQHQGHQQVQRQCWKRWHHTSLA